MKAVAHMSLSNLWEKVWQHLDNSITLLSPILGPIHHWPSKKINSEGISTTLGYWFWEKREILEIICPLTLREFARNSAAWFYVTTLQKKKKNKNYPKDNHWGVISTKMVLRYTGASAAERLQKIGYVLKANPRKLFDKCSLLLHSSWGVVLSLNMLLRKHGATKTLKVRFHTCNFIHTEINLHVYITLFSVLIKLMHTW